MEWILGGVLVLSLLAIVFLPGLINQAADRRLTKRIESDREAREKSEAEYIAQLPKLDTSRMLQIKMTDSQIESSKKYGGTFGSRYIHMQVVDRDGRNYLCFMTAYNIEALWRSKFVQGGFTPYLIEGAPEFIVDGETISAYPAALKPFDHDSLLWRLWAKLHREFYAFKGDYFDVFREFFDLGEPREVPLSKATA